MGCVYTCLDEYHIANTIYGTIAHRSCKFIPQLYVENAIAQVCYILYCVVLCCIVLFYVVLFLSEGERECVCVFVHVCVCVFVYRYVCM